MVSFGKNIGLVVSDPEMIKQILVKEFDAFHDRTVSLRGVF